MSGISTEQIVDVVSAWNKPVGDLVAAQFKELQNTIYYMKRYAEQDKERIKDLERQLGERDASRS